MNRAAHPITCPVTGCNYPEAECPGTCLPQRLRDEARRNDDSLTTAAICFGGALAVLLVGICATIAAALVSWLASYL